MEKYLIQQWCALVKKIEDETTRYMSRYHYFFGYSGAALGVAILAIRSKPTEPPAVGVVVTIIALLTSVITAYVALSLVHQYIDTRWLWREALKLIESSILTDKDSEYIKRVSNDTSLFFPVYTQLAKWKKPHEPTRTERTMRRVARLWFGATIIFLVSYFTYESFQLCSLFHVAST
jgi:hypothetical protein